MAGTVEARIKELGHALPKVPPPIGLYVPAVRTGNLVMTSGQLPLVDGQLAFAGAVGGDVSEKDGAAAARFCVVNALAAIKAEIGELDDVKRVVRLDGFVQSTPDFDAQPAVLNGASQFLVDVFGDIGRHTRMAIGVNALPMNAPVEVAVWVEV